MKPEWNAAVWRALWNTAAPDEADRVVGRWLFTAHRIMAARGVAAARDGAAAIPAVLAGAGGRMRAS